MAKFLTSLTVTEINDGVFAVSYKPFLYQSDLYGPVIEVPIGFYTDFSSVPRLGIIYSCLGNVAHQPAVIHDWLYYAALTTRKLADQILLEAMIVIDLPFWRRWPIYLGVRAGGWNAWNVHRKDGNPKAGKYKDSPNILGKPDGL